MRKKQYVEFVISTIVAIAVIFLIYYLAPGSSEKINLLNFNHWQEAFSLLMPRLLVTLILTIGAILISLFIAVPLGISLADREYGYISFSPQKQFLKKIVFNKMFKGLNRISRCGYIFFAVISSFPIFYVSYFCWAYFFGLQDRMLSLKNTNSLVYLMIPIAVISFGNGLLGEFIRTIREETNHILKQNYIVAAIARGIPITRHLFKNFIIPIANLISSRIVVLLSGAVIVEIIFNISGVGKWAYDIVIFQRGHIISSYYIIVITVSLSLLVNAIHLLNRWLQVKIDPRNQ